MTDFRYPLRQAPPRTGRHTAAQIARGAQLRAWSLLCGAQIARIFGAHASLSGQTSSGQLTMRVAGLLTVLGGSRGSLSPEMWQVWLAVLAARWGLAVSGLVARFSARDRAYPTPAGHDSLRSGVRSSARSNRFALQRRLASGSTRVWLALSSARWGNPVCRVTRNVRLATRRIERPGGSWARGPRSWVIGRISGAQVARSAHARAIARTRREFGCWTCGADESCCR